MMPFRSNTVKETNRVTDMVQSTALLTVNTLCQAKKVASRPAVGEPK